MQSSSPPKPLVLLVEPDAVALRTTTWFFTKAGHEVIRATTARAALDRIRGLLSPLTAAIVEVELPDLDGIQLAEQIQRLYPGLPTLFTTKIEDLQVEGALNAPNTTLLKPFSMSSLMAAFQGLMPQESVPRSVSRTSMRAQTGQPVLDEAASDSPRFPRRI